MSELTLFILRFGFLGLMWFFVFAVVYALRSDLFGQRSRKSSDAAAVASVAAPAVASPAPNRRPSPAPQKAAPASSSLSATRLVITGGAKEGLELPLPPDTLTIGRASESGLVIRDDYTSTHHARLLLWQDGWVIQDLDSTNGTYLDGTRVVVPTQVPVNTPVKIGTTSFELRR
ncbi:MAG: FHA domain-containing protein FhaB/FipA [Microbacteriaceae bacterium]